MNVQNVNNAASWADFVKLVQQARTRSMMQAGHAATVRHAGPAAAPQAARPGYGVTVSRQAAASPAQPTKIAGGLFDAYA